MIASNLTDYRSPAVNSASAGGVVTQSPALPPTAEDSVDVGDGTSPSWRWGAWNDDEESGKARSASGQFSTAVDVDSLLIVVGKSVVGGPPSSAAQHDCGSGSSAQRRQRFFRSSAATGWRWLSWRRSNVVSTVEPRLSDEPAEHMAAQAAHRSVSSVYWTPKTESCVMSPGRKLCKHATRSNEASANERRYGSLWNAACSGASWFRLVQSTPKCACWHEHICICILIF